MIRKIALGLFIPAAAAALVFSAGCSTAPPTQEAKAHLQRTTSDVLAEEYQKDPSLHDFLNNAYAYAVFPTVGSGGLVAGGSYGHGEVYQNGKLIGYADISQATVGAQVGGESFTEIIAFETPEALDQFKRGELKLTADASVAFLKSGIAANVKFMHGVAIFVDVRGGLMAAAVVGGQTFSYQPVGG